jgi:hypothetical protein
LTLISLILELLNLSKGNLKEVEDLWAPKKFVGGDLDTEAL